MRLNAIAPGNVRTAMTANMLPEQRAAMEAIPVPTHFGEEPLMEPIDRPNSTMPISAVETDKISRMAGVRVAQEAISRPGMKKNINSAHRRSCRAFRGEVSVIGIAPEVQQ